MFTFHLCKNMSKLTSLQAGSTANVIFCRAVIRMVNMDKVLILPQVDCLIVLVIYLHAVLMLLMELKHVVYSGVFACMIYVMVNNEVPCTTI